MDRRMLMAGWRDRGWLADPTPHLAGGPRMEVGWR